MQYRDREFSKTFTSMIPIHSRLLPVLKKRSISLGAANENKLIQKQIKKLKKEKKTKLQKAIDADPFLKLRFTLGEATLKYVQQTNPKLFQIIQDNASKA